MKRSSLLVAILFSTASAAVSMASGKAPVGVDQSSSAGSTVLLDPRWQELKASVLDTQAQAQALLDKGVFPSDARVNIYVGQDASGKLLRSISFGIDDGPPNLVEIEGDAASALAETHDLRRIKRINVPDGPHELHVDFHYSEPQEAGLALAQVSLNQHFEKEPGSIDIALKLIDGRLFSSAHVETSLLRPKLTKRSWFKAVADVATSGAGDVYYVRGSADDPDMRYVRHLLRIGDFDDAAIELSTLATDVANDKALSNQYWLQAAEAYRMAGLPDRAQTICDLLESRRVDKQVIAVERLHLGEAQYQRGDLTQSGVQLAAARTHLSAFQAQDWRFVDAQLLFSLNRPAEAIAVLKQANPDPVEALRFMSDPETSLRSAVYRRFNLAAAMMQNGDEEQGLSWLDLVGRLRSRDETLLALRDKANLSLGWHFLRVKQGRTALGVLGRVRSEGLFANAALLGAGWAQLVPAGERQLRTRLPDDTLQNPDLVQELPALMKNSLTQLKVLEPETRGASGPPSFARDDPPADRKEGLRRAIKLWEVLAQRDQDDQAVQEGVLAIAYAYDQLDDRPHARDAYARAIDMLQSTKQRLADSSAFVQQGRFSETIDQADDEAALLLAMQPLRLAPEESTAGLYATLDRYRNFGKLQNTLKQLDQRLSADNAAPGSEPDNPAAAAAADAASSLLPRLRALEQSLASEHDEDAARIRSIALSLLNGRSQAIDQYLKAAYFSAAQVADRSYRNDGQK